jgi:hypothetical protein
LLDQCSSQARGFLGNTLVDKKKEEQFINRDLQHIQGGACQQHRVQPLLSRNGLEAQYRASAMAGLGLFLYFFSQSNIQPLHAYGKCCGSRSAELSFVWLSLAGREQPITHTGIMPPVYRASKYTRLTYDIRHPGWSACPAAAAAAWEGKASLMLVGNSHCHPSMALVKPDLAPAVREEATKTVLPKQVAEHTAFGSCIPCRHLFCWPCSCSSFHLMHSALLAAPLGLNPQNLPGRTCLTAGGWCSWWSR